MIQYARLTDNELIVLLRSNDQGAFGEIFTRYYSLLYIHACKKFNDKEEAKDIVQDVFTLVWSKRADLEIKSNLAGYLYTGMHHKMLNLIAHKKTANTYLDSLQKFLSEYLPSADYLIREKQLMAIIDREIDLLPPKMREVFKLSRKKQMSHKEIAEQLNISEETVKSQIKNALKILRIKLGLFTFLLFLFKH